MGTEVPLHNYITGGNIISNYDDHEGNLRSGDSFVEDASDEVRNNGSSQPPADGADRISDIDSGALTENSLDHRDEASNTVDCLDESYKTPTQIATVLIEDDRSSLESSGSLRNHCNSLTIKDIMPIEDARSRFLQIIVDNFLSQHLIEKRGTSIENTDEHGEDKVNKRKLGEVQYEGDPRFVLPLMYVANLYETLAEEVNLKIASLHGLRDKTIAVALEASGGLYRKLTQKFPKTGSYSFKRRELATSLETRTRFPELVVQEEKRVRFVVANGLDIIEKPNGVPAEDAEWFKMLTGRTEVAITSRDYKFYNPRHKVRRASLNCSPSFAGYASPRPGTPSKYPIVSMSRQPHFDAVKLHEPESPDQNQQTTLLFHTHESGQSSDLRDNTPTHPSHVQSQNMGSMHFLSGNQGMGHHNIMANSPAKFCDECGSPYLRATSKFCSQCGTKRFGI